MWRIVRRGARTRASRLVLSLTAVVAALSFVGATHVVAATSNDSIHRIFTDLYGGTDLYVKGKSGANGTLDAVFGGGRSVVEGTALPRIRAVDGVAAAEGQVLASTTVLDARGQPIRGSKFPPTFASNWLPEALNRWTLVEGRAPSARDEVVVDAGTAADQHLRPGSALQYIDARSERTTARVAGVARFGAQDSQGGATFVLMPTSTAQEQFLAPGQFNWLLVDANAATDATALRTKVRAVTDPHTRVVTGAQSARDAEATLSTFVDLLHRFLLAFGYVALFAGACSAYNAFTTVAAQRRREIAMLRVLGATRRQVMGAVVLEACCFAVLAAALSAVVAVGLGWLAAHGLVAGGLMSATDGIEIPPGVVALVVGLAFAITASASLGPALRSYRVAPIESLRADLEPLPRHTRRRVLAGVAAACYGASAIMTGLGSPAQERVVGVGRGLLAILVAAALLLPVAWPVVLSIGALPARWCAGIVVQLAARNNTRNPQRSARLAAAVVIGAALLSAASIMAATVADDDEAAYRRSLSADVIVSPGDRASSVPDGVARTVASDPDVAAAVGIRIAGGELDNHPAAVLGADPEALFEVLRLHVTDGELASLRDPDGRSIAVPARFAHAHGWHVGTELTGEFAQAGYERVRVAVVVEGDLPPGATDAMIMPVEQFDRRVPTPERVDRVVLARTQAGTDAAVARARIRTSLAAHPSLRVQDAGSFAADQVALARTLLDLVTAVLVSALAIALIGVANTTLAAAASRVREIGLLRAVGMQRTQVRSMFRVEAAMVVGTAVTAGLLAGLAGGWVLARAASGADIVAVPWARIVLLTSLLAALALLASMFAGHRASRAPVLAALSADAT